MTECSEALCGMIHSSETPSVLADITVAPRGNDGLPDPMPTNDRSLWMEEIEFIRVENIFVKPLNR